MLFRQCTTLFVCAFLVSAFINRPALAVAEPAAAVGIQNPHSVPPLLAARYWNNFKTYWQEKFGRQDGIVLIALGVGVVGIIIICSGKWVK